MAGTQEFAAMRTQGFYWRELEEQLPIASREAVAERPEQHLNKTHISGFKQV